MISGAYPLSYLPSAVVALDVIDALDDAQGDLPTLDDVFELDADCTLDDTCEI